MSNKASRVSQDQAILGVNITALIAYLLVFQASYTNVYAKIAIMISLSLFVISLLMYLWHISRHPLRQRLWKKLSKEFKGKYVMRLKAYLEDIVGPLAFFQGQEAGRKHAEKLIKSAKTKEERDQVFERLHKEKELLEEEIKKQDDSPNHDQMPERPGDKAHSYFVEAITFQMQHELREKYKEAFRKPLKEKGGRIKFVADTLSRKFRLYVFIAACTGSVISMYIQLLVSK